MNPTQDAVFTGLLLWFWLVAMLMLGESITRRRKRP